MPGFIAVSQSVGKDFRPPPQGAVNDYANVISIENEKQLESSISSDLADETGVHIQICIRHHIDDETIDGYATGLMERWWNGGKSILIVSVLDRRKVQIKAKDRIISDDQIDDILQKSLVPNFKKGDFDTGFLAAVQAVADKLKER